MKTIEIMKQKIGNLSRILARLPLIFAIFSRI